MATVNKNRFFDYARESEFESYQPRELLSYFAKVADVYAVATLDGSEVPEHVQKLFDRLSVAVSEMPNLEEEMAAYEEAYEHHERNIFDFERSLRVGEHSYAGGMQEHEKGRWAQSPIADSELAQRVKKLQARQAKYKNKYNYGV